MRGLIIQMLGIEAVRRAQERFGKGKVMTTEQVRWGLENLALDQKKLDALGFAGVMRPVSTSCTDHMGSTYARIHTWDGAKWDFSSDWYQADEADPQADDQGGGRQVRRREEADAAHARGLPELIRTAPTPSPPSVWEGSVAPQPRPAGRAPRGALIEAPHATLR